MYLSKLYHQQRNQELNSPLQRFETNVPFKLFRTAYRQLSFLNAGIDIVRSKTFLFHPAKALSDILEGCFGP